MFWKKKNTVEFDGLPVVLSRRIKKTLGLPDVIHSSFFDETTKQFLAYKAGNEWRGLVGYEQFRGEVDMVNKKLDLILDHLNLEYVPETEKKEPAKLIEKKDVIMCDFYPSVKAALIQQFEQQETTLGKPKKKKAGRPKKK